MKSNDKVQLNLCVDPGTDAQFRDMAVKSGFGKRPSPFMGKLLDVYSGNMRALHKRVEELLEHEPDTLMQREQLFYAQELFILLRDQITQAQTRMSREKMPRDDGQEKV